MPLGGRIASLSPCVEDKETIGLRARVRAKPMQKTKRLIGVKAALGLSARVRAKPMNEVLKRHWGLERSWH